MGDPGLVASALPPQATVRSLAMLTDTANGCVVLPPRTGRVRGIVHFLGGAFVGAAPQLAYPLLLRRLSAAGYTVICVPYKVTFKHLECAAKVKERFEGAVRELEDSGRGLMVPEGVPIVGLGHSNGSLMHMLGGALYSPGAVDDRRVANAVMSFNNKQVSDAIPIPGFLNNVKPVADTLESFGVR